MGKYTNVQADAIISAVDTAMSELSSYHMATVIGKLPQNTSVFTRASNAMKEITMYKNYSGTVPKLKEKLEKLKNAASVIKEWQQNEEDLKSAEYWRDYYEGEKNDRWSRYKYNAGQRDYYWKLDWNVYTYAESNYNYYKGWAQTRYNQYSDFNKKYNTAKKSCEDLKERLNNKETIIDGYLG